MRRVASRLLLGVAALAVAAFALEATWRFVRSRGWGPTTNPALVVHDDRLGWRYRPGARARHRTDEFDVSIRINSRGFRGPEVPFQRTPGRKRIVALGDSFTFGWGVEEEETWPARLARILDVEVVNLGVSGYGTDQEYILLQSEGRAYRPDVVLVQVAPNDAEEVMRDSIYGKRKPAFRLEASGSDASPSLVPRVGAVRLPFLERVSVFAGSVRRIWEEETREPLDAASREEGWALAGRLLAAMEDASSPAPLCVVGDVGSGRAFPIGCSIDVTPILARAEREGGPVRFLRDKHWNARGHRLVAEAVAAALRERGLVE